MSVESIVEDFYSPENRGVPVTHLYRDSSGTDVRKEEFLLRRPADPLEELELNHEAVVANMKEATENLRVIRSGTSTFEISTIGSGPVLTHKSTYNSAESTNKGNLREHANLAARFPGFTHLYIASFGNGGTSPLTDHEDEGRYVSKTGRFTRVNSRNEAEPIYSIRKEYEALTEAGLDVSMIFGTDSAGGSYATALALAMEPGQLKKAFFSEHAGFVDLSFREIAYGMLRTEMKHGQENKKLSPDPEAMTEPKIKEAGELYEQYITVETRQQLAAAQTSLYERGRNMWRVVNALRRGPRTGENPLLEDTNLLLEHQPDAKVVFGMAERDVLYRNAPTCHRAAQELLQGLVPHEAGVGAMILPDMSHAYHTYMPALYHALMRRAILD